MELRSNRSRETVSHCKYPNDLPPCRESERERARERERERGRERERESPGCVQARESAREREREHCKKKKKKRKSRKRRRRRSTERESGRVSQFPQSCPYRMGGLLVRGTSHVPLALERARETRESKQSWKKPYYGLRQWRWQVALAALTGRAVKKLSILGKSHCSQDAWLVQFDIS